MHCEMVQRARSLRKIQNVPVSPLQWWLTQVSTELGEGHT
jgi:hypothetical protein